MTNRQIWEKLIEVDSRLRDIEIKVAAIMEVIGEKEKVYPYLRLLRFFFPLFFSIFALIFFLLIHLYAKIY